MEESRDPQLERMLRTNLSWRGWRDDRITNGSPALSSGEGKSEGSLYGCEKRRACRRWVFFWLYMPFGEVDISPMYIWQKEILHVANILAVLVSPYYTSIASIHWSSNSILSLPPSSTISTTTSCVHNRCSKSTAGSLVVPSSIEYFKRYFAVRIEEFVVRHLTLGQVASVCNIFARSSSKWDWTRFGSVTAIRSEEKRK